MKLVVMIFLLFKSLYAQNILLIGDSHTAGPFGQNLHKELSQYFNPITFGHASSAPIHWLGDTNYYLSGGVFNNLTLNEVTLNNPINTHWRDKVRVPKLKELIVDVRYHETWKKRVDFLNVDSVIFLLGANDARAISSQEGVINPVEYRRRKKAIRDMIDLIGDRKCFWVGPPNGIKKSKQNQNTLYGFLEDSIGDRCEFFNSNHVMVKHCDGIHMNCAKESENAFKYAKEVSDFIFQKLYLL